MTEGRGASRAHEAEDVGLYLGAALAIPVAILICLALFGALFWRL